MKKKIALFALSVFLITSLNAQTDSTNVDTLKRVKVSLSFSHNTRLNYFGRTDSIKSGGFFPSLEFNFGKHFYLRGTAVFSYSRHIKFLYNGTVLQGGYQFNKNNKWLGDLYFAKIIYQDQSTLVQSALKSQAGFNLSFLNKYLNLNAGTDIKFSDKIDFGATSSVDHLFKVIEKNKTKLFIDPFAAIYAGTQNFSYSHREKQNQFFDIIQPGRENTVNVKSFNVLAYELGSPVVLMHSKFQFTINPSYILPQNLLSVPEKPELSERGENIFYVTTGLKYSF